MFNAQFTFDFENVKYDGNVGSLELQLTFFEGWFDKFERDGFGGLYVVLSKDALNEHFATDDLLAEVALLKQLCSLLKLGYMETKDEKFLFQFNFIDTKVLFSQDVSEIIRKLGMLEANIK